MKIYVINLDKRSDRLLFVSKQLSNYTWERFPAVDGYRLNNQILQGMGFYPEQQWIDPLLKRKLTYTEIATSISHYKLWEKCVELDEPIIILEDDGELKQPLDFDEIQTLLASNDIVYLDHREMFPQVAVVEDKFTVPYYPYLATGYAISPATAKKLIHTGFNYNIIPVDEFFPIILGVDYTKHSLGNPNLFLKLQQDYNTQIKAIAYTESVYKQVSRSILGSDIEGTRMLSEDPGTLHVVTIGTDIALTANLLKSATQFNIDVTNIGEGVVWHGGDMKGPGGGQKINLMKEYLKHLPDEDIVLFCDGYDVVFADDIQTILERYKQFNIPVLFAAEKNCWPNISMASFFDAETPYKYPNSGLYIGTAAALSKLFEPTITDASDDQLYVQIQILKNPQLVQLDTENYIFQCLAGAEAAVSIKSNGQLYNTETNCCPCILHGNGGGETKTTFDRFVSKILGNETLSYVDTTDFKVIGNEILEMSFLTPEMCKQLIDIAEADGRWKSMYGDKFPGQEIRIRDISVDLFNQLEKHFMGSVRKVVEGYWAPTSLYGLRDAFIIKYSPTTQDRLNCHNDASMVSGMVKLNDDYTGGDTYFYRQKFSNINTPMGNIILWPGQVTHGHEGRKVMSGTKYNLVIWTSRHKSDLNY